ncbi:hypothetical protein SAE01_23070 [Segetibacter aerophilus]|uniref:Uncharacterized protein n=1 Tax=Segetibacter aerophilus TaxID=670293 RepID=A0A512BCX5_9BACT|nr:hypothetical protein SAE01_23070 [Segetibacter aerophilus]
MGIVEKMLSNAISVRVVAFYFKSHYCKRIIRILFLALLRKLNLVENKLAFFEEGYIKD